MKRSLLFCFLVLVVAIVPALADVTFTWQTATITIEKMGNNGYNSSFDYLTLNGLSGSMTLSPGSSQTTTVSNGEFFVGPSCGGCSGDNTWTGTVSRNLTVGGVTQAVVNPWTLITGDVYDRLAIHDGAPVVFNVSGHSVTVTPFGAAFAPNDGSVAGLANLDANFAVPDGGMTLALLGGALMGLTVLRRKFGV